MQTFQVKWRNVLCPVPEDITEVATEVVTADTMAVVTAVTMEAVTVDTMEAVTFPLGRTGMTDAAPTTAAVVWAAWCR